MAYAESTTVPVEKSRYEIESLLRKYGATQFVSGWDEKSAFITFRARDRVIRMKVEIPARTEKRFTHKKARASYLPDIKLDERKQNELYDQFLRTRFRALLLVIKAKLESVEAGIETFEIAFLAHVVLPNKQLVGDVVQAWVADSYRGSHAALPESGESTVD